MDGDYYTEGAKGVIRLTQVNQMGSAQAPVQVDRERCVIEGVVDGLTPGAHGLAIHETGDVSRFEVSNILLFGYPNLSTLVGYENYFFVLFPTFYAGVAQVWVDISIQEALDMGPLSSMRTKDM